jgi:excisionase family DNA binding protein
LTDHARDLIEQSTREERESRKVMRRARMKDQPIANPETHPRRFVSLTVAAAFLEVDRKTLNTWLANRELAFTWFGRRRKIAVAELVAYQQRQTVERKAG